jgi:3-hydroxybutyryl-CoA dehydrogenase
MARDITTVGVTGLGTMGAGIVEVFARGGLQVVATEVDDAALERGRGVLARSTTRAVAKGRLEQSEADALHGRVTFTTDLAGLADCDLVVEAVPERPALKHELFRRLDDVVAPGAVLATNTSSLSVTDIAVATAHPERVVGMHFFNPAPVQRLVEVVTTVVTDDEVRDSVRALAERLGKTPVVVGDRAGFIGNALLFGYLGHAVSMLESGRATRDDIDTAARVGLGYPMGPLALLDLIGLDTAEAILTTMYEQGRDRLHAPSPLLTELVAAGHLGRKTGRGFFVYPPPGSGGGDTAAPDAGGPAAGVREVGRVVVVATGDDDSAAAVDDRLGTWVDDLTAAGVDVDRVTISNSGDGDARLAAADVALVDVPPGDPGAALVATVAGTLTDGAVVALTGAGADGSLAALAAATGRPADVVGLQPVTPVASAPLVEVVVGLDTSESTVATARALCERLGRTAVTTRDRAGRLVEALLVPYLCDALRMVQDGYASADDVDTAMRNGCGLPRGPVQALDELGLDVALDAARRLHAETGEPGHAPPPLLTQLVAAGRLGSRTGEGVRRHP